MATIQKAIRLVNPGQRKGKRLTLRQKLFFGSKRQRTHAREALGRRNPGPGSRYKKAIGTGHIRKAIYYRREHGRRLEAKKRRSRAGASFPRGFESGKLPNVGEIITIYPALTGVGNPGTKKGKNKGMAKTHRRSKISHAAAVKRARKAARTRARHHSVGHRTRTRRKRHNPSSKVVTRYIRRTVHNRSSRRGGRNPGSSMFQSQFGKAVGVIAGAFVTRFATNMLPAQFNTGILGYVATGIVAMLQGKMVGKLLKNPSLGNDMALGGYVYLAIRIANDYFPSLGLPFGLQGMGNVIGPSSFWTPQVPINGSMGQFVSPAQMMAAIPAPVAVAGGMRGMGMTRRMGRMR